MPSLNLLFKREYPINDSINIIIPTVGEIIDDEDNYYNLVSILTSMPIDMCVQLDDAGIDFTTVNEYELFIMMFQIVAEQDTRLIFGNMDLSKFIVAVNQQNGNVVLRDEENDITIDRAIQGQIARVLRKIHHLEKNNRKPANKEAKEFLIERARKKQQRHHNRVEDSELESLVIAMVNTEQFKYGYEETRELTIYQFNESVRQIIKKVDYDNRMFGIYSGTISAKNVSQKDLNWLIHD